MSAWAVVARPIDGRCCREVKAEWAPLHPVPPRQCHFRAQREIDGLALCERHYREYLSFKAWREGRADWPAEPADDENPVTPVDYRPAGRLRSNRDGRRDCGAGDALPADHRVVVQPGRRTAGLKELATVRKECELWKKN